MALMKIIPLIASARRRTRDELLAELEALARQVRTADQIAQAQIDDLKRRVEELEI